MKSYRRVPRALAALLLAQLNLQPATPQQAEQQLNGVAEEGRERSEYWQDKHEHEETNRKLNDIEDAIIFNGAEDGTGD
jgi:hypothetical protein